MYDWKKIFKNEFRLKLYIPSQKRVNWHGVALPHPMYTNVDRREQVRELLLYRLLLRANMCHFRCYLNVKKYYE